jgi:hypothetical protein
MIFRIKMRYNVLIFALLFSVLVGCAPDIVVEPPELTLDYEEPYVFGSSPSDWGSTDPNMEWNPVKPKVEYDNPLTPKIAIGSDIDELRMRIRISENAFKEMKDKGGSGKKTGFGTGCFAPETNVLIADGLIKRIGDLAVGDKIKGYDLLNGAFVDVTVLRIYKTRRDSYLLVNGVKVTAEHPFYTERIWSEASTKDKYLNDDMWVEAKDLSMGSKLFDGSTVKRIEIVEETGSFVNLTVDGVNNYIVVDDNGDRYLVHNKEVKF